MSVTVDNSNHFQPEIESIEEFIERFKVQNSVKLAAAAGDSKQRAMLLINCLPVKVVTDIQRRIKPKLLSSATYDDIQSNLLAGYKVKKSLIGASVNFLTRKQQNEETIETYAKSLNELASHCSYSDCCRDRMLRDVFISGVRSSKIMQHLMTECENKTFNDVIEKAKMFEQVSQDVEDIKPRDYSTNKVMPASSKEIPTSTAKSVSNNYICIRCGTKAKHFANECFALKLKCNSCGKIGHIGKACRSKNKPAFKNNDSNVSNYIFPEEESYDDIAMNAVFPEIPDESHRTSVVVDPIVPLQNKYDSLDMASHSAASADCETLPSPMPVHNTRSDNGKPSSPSFLGINMI